MANDNKEKLAIVEAAAAHLAEHFDTVRIFVTKHQGEEDGTLGLTAGEGNIFAQKGQVQDWIDEQYFDAKAINADGEEEDG